MKPHPIPQRAASSSRRGVARRAARLLATVVLALGVAGMAWILVLMVVMNVDIVGRYLFNEPLTGAPEFVTGSVSALVFLLLPQTVLAGRVTQVTLFLDLLRARAPSAALALDRFYLVMGAVVYAGLAWWMFPKMLQAQRSGAFVGAEGIFRFPEWPVFAIICLGALIAALSCLARLDDPGDPS